MMARYPRRSGRAVFGVMLREALRWLRQAESNLSLPGADGVNARLARRSESGAATWSAGDWPE